MAKTTILPASIEDLNNIALEKCIQTAFDIDVNNCLKYPVDNAKDELLPYLAEENHILGAEGWNLTNTRAEKVDMIKSSCLLHSTKGSIPSIIKALSILNIEAKLQEFWEYGGKIGHFMFEFLNIKKREFNEIVENQIIQLINAYKPKTRILDKINYYLSNDGFLYVSARVRSFETVTISTREAVI